MSAWAKLYATWLTRPHQEGMPVMSVGVGKLEMASIIALVGFTPSSVMVKPPKPTLSFLNTDLSGLKIVILCTVGEVFHHMPKG